VAFAYDSYTTPSKNNGVLRATLTHARGCRNQLNASSPEMNESGTIESIILHKDRSRRDWDSELIPDTSLKTIHE